MKLATVSEVGDTEAAVLRFKQRQGLGSSGWAVSCYVNQADLKLPKIHLPLPLPVLGFKVCAITPGNFYMSLIGTLGDLRQ